MDKLVVKQPGEKAFPNGQNGKSHNKTNSPNNSANNRKKIFLQDNKRNKQERKNGQKIVEIPPQINTVGMDRDYYYNSNATINAIIPFTDVLLQDPSSIDELRQGGNVVYIPMSVIHHLNELKNKPGLREDAVEVGARIEEALAKHDGSLIIYNEYDYNIMERLNLNRNDLQHLTIAAANKIYSSCRDNYKQVKLISLDGYIRIIAKQLGNGRLKIENYLRENISVLGKGRAVPTINVDKKKIKLSDTGFYLEYSETEYGKILENDGVICYSNLPDKGLDLISANAMLGEKFCALKKGKRLIVLESTAKLFGLSPLSKKANMPNYEQQIAIHKLLDFSYQCHFLQGGPGCGKTLFALAGGLNWLENTENNRLKRLLFICPMVHVNDEDNMGFLPGDIDKKLSPWIKPATDNLEVLERYNYNLLTLCNENKQQSKNGRRKNKLTVAQDGAAPKNWLYNKLKREGKITFEPIDYLRGRTINNAYIIVDDAQNLTRLYSLVRIL